MKFNTKKLMTILLAVTMVFSIAACGNADDPPATAAPPVNDAPSVGGETPSDGGDGTPATAAPTEAPSVIDTPSGGGDLRVLSLSDSIDFDFVVLQFSERTVEIDMGRNAMFGDNLYGVHTAEDAIRMPFQQIHYWGVKKPDETPPAYIDGFEYKEYENVIFQNGPFWQNVSHITADFYILAADDATYIDDIGEGFAQQFIQTGGAMSWNWWNNSFNFYHQFEDNAFVEGGVMTVTWDIKPRMDLYGNDSVGTFDDNGFFDDKGGGILKFGLQVGNSGFDPINITLCWADVNIYVYDLDIFFDYVDQVTAINGNTLSDDMKARVHKA